MLNHAKKLDSKTYNMEINELYLKTAFCCMACDGEIANKEIESIKQYIAENPNIFQGIDAEKLLNDYISEINSCGKAFLQNYIKELSNVTLSEEEQMAIIKLAISIIESDNMIEYSEVAFFKKIRFKLPVSDERIIAELPDKKEYLMPDIIEDDDDWSAMTFEYINL